MTKILLLDSSSLIYRAYFAMERAGLTDADGNPTGALYGYLNMLLRLIDDVKPTHIAAAFDVHAPTFRHKEYAAYKGTRKPTPEDLVSQLPRLRELFAAMDIRILEREGYEADDIIGTIAHRFDCETVIVSGDKDCLQLIDDSTVVFHTKRGVTDIVKYDLQLLKQEMGFIPSQIVDYKALAGDHSDNIPGCAGVGETTAKNLLATYGDVDGIYCHIDEIKGAIGKKLADNRATVELSHHLATICTDAPIECTLDDIRFDGFSVGLKDLLTKLQFRTLIPRATKHIVGAATVVDGEQAMTDFKASADGVERIIVDCDGAKAVLKGIKSNTPIAVWYGEHIHFAVDADHEYVVEIAHTLLDLLGSSDPGKELKTIFSTPNPKLLFGAKSVMRTLKTEFDLDIRGAFDDVQLMAYLVNSSLSVESVNVIMSDDAIAKQLFATAIFRSAEKLSALIEENHLLSLYKNVELPLETVLFDMETAGFKVDVATLDRLHVQYTSEMSEVVSEIYRIAGGEFNVNSTQQLGEILFGKLGLTGGKKNSRGYSVTAEILEHLEHPIIPYLLRYRRIQKLLSTYVDGMKTVINPRDGKVHTVFKQCLTTTGRLSSTEPNLQNIPVRDKEGREMRKMFVASDGNVLVGADYSQIELRLLAHFSGDEHLISAYEHGADIHRETAAKVLGIPESEVTPEQRSQAKAVNFGIIYGISGFGLAENLKISQRDAKMFQQRYFENFPTVETFMKQNVQTAHAQGYITTLLGRIRRFPEFLSDNRNVRNFAERAAMNMPLQGSASDIIKLAMIGVARAIKCEKLSAKLILQVHDELIVDTPQGEVETVKYILKREMENAVKLRVPLPVEVGVGYSWFDAK